MLQLVERLDIMKCERIITQTCKLNLFSCEILHGYEVVNSDSLEIKLLFPPFMLSFPCFSNRLEEEEEQIARKREERRLQSLQR